MLPRFDGLESQDADEMMDYLQLLLSVCEKLMRRVVSHSVRKAVFSSELGWYLQKRGELTMYCFSRSSMRCKLFERVCLDMISAMMQVVDCRNF